MTRSLVEAVTAVKQQFPPGDEALYDWDTPASWTARDLRTKARSQLALWAQQEKLRRELVPQTAVELLPDWEQLFNLSKSAVSLYGSTLARQAQLVARWREFGPANPTIILAALQAVCGAGAVTILEHSRAVLTAENWYDFPPASLPLTITASADSEIDVVCGDNAPASKAGARVTLRVTHPSVEDLYLTVYAPDGTASQRFYFGSGAVVSQDFAFRWKSAAGLDISGTWRIVISDGGGVGGTVEDPAGDGISGLFVEGLGRNQLTGAEGLAANIFEWSARVTESAVASTYDRNLVRELVRHWNPAHCRGYLVLSGVGDGVSADAGIWGEPTNSDWDGFTWE